MEIYLHASGGIEQDFFIKFTLNLQHYKLEGWVFLFSLPSNHA